jgi:predicted ribosome quality control (RQC) complex YloA/Tae2 family protein
VKYIQYFNESKKDKLNYQKLKIGEFECFRGRDGKSNEYITFKIADENDLWFHARGVQGSHLIIKNGGEEVGSDVINEAAKLVAKNSKTNSKEVVVIYCQRKFVTKNPGSPVGSVEPDYNNCHKISVYLN